MLVSKVPVPQHVTVRGGVSRYVVNPSEWPEFTDFMDVEGSAFEVKSRIVDNDVS